jgi:hypothetical protein
LGVYTKINTFVETSAQGSAAALRQQEGNLFSVAAIIQLNNTAFLDAPLG